MHRKEKKGTHQPFLLALKDSESPEAAILYLGLPWASFSPILNTEQFGSILPSFSLLIHACAPLCMHTQACVTMHTLAHTHLSLDTPLHINVLKASKGEFPEFQNLLVKLAGETQIFIFLSLFLILPCMHYVSCFQHTPILQLKPWGSEGLGTLSKFPQQVRKKGCKLKFVCSCFLHST